MTERNRGKAPKYTPLTQVICAGIQRGRRILSATYPSSRPNVPAHETIFLDDGHFESCTCNAAQRGVTCWHAKTGDAVVPEYHRREHLTDQPDLLAAYISSLELHLTFPLDESDRAAADYELIGLRQAQQDTSKVAA